MEIGSVVGPYRILGLIGAGGMGEVYRAQDTKLHREVAIKVLPRATASDHHHLERLQREAHLLASLNHPNIATIYGLEEATVGEARQTLCLVMEFVAGETLDERIAGSPIPLDELLPIFRQIADGLEAAHASDIVHRDLKPSNVIVTPDGKVKLLDFGLAKGATARAVPTSDEGTTLQRKLTASGLIVGTTAYMSPEQARGRQIDKRSDIWSFGCILFEALTGRAAFSGATVSDTLVSILQETPDWTLLPSTVPPSIRTLLRRCLERDKERRLRDIWDARIEIDEAIALSKGRSEATETPSYFLSTDEAIPRSASRGRLAVWWTAPIFLVAAVLGWIGGTLSETKSDTAFVTRSTIALPDELRIRAWNATLALSPDGKTIAFVGDETPPRLYVRALDRLAVTPIPGTDGLVFPRGLFFSPDSKWVAFYDGYELKKVPLSGGEVTTLARTYVQGTGGSWAEDGTIYFAGGRGILRVSSQGGEPEHVTRVDPEAGEVSHEHPQLLPGGKGLLLGVWMGGHFDTNHIDVVSLADGTRGTLVRGGSHPAYSPTGHLLYARDGRLFAVRFDLDTLQTSGAPVSVIDELYTDGERGEKNYAFSRRGDLVYVRGPSESRRGNMVLVTAGGERVPISGDEPASYSLPRFSPDGTRLAVWRLDHNRDLWIYDLERKLWTRFTTDPGFDGWPVWSPDGANIVFLSSRVGGNRNESWFRLFRKRSDGGGPAEFLFEGEYEPYPSSWSPDGKELAFVQRNGTGDISILDLETGRAKPFRSTEFNDENPRFSPDGRWLAYSTDESGRSEVYVEPYPGPGPRSRVSSNGGLDPVWTRNGRVLFYLEGDRVVKIPVSTNPSLEIGRAVEAFPAVERGVVQGSFDVDPTGEQLVMVENEAQSEPEEIVVVHDWFSDLTVRVPPS